jgi:site-specific DNA-methyltransferase (adenine-specific)
VSIIQIHHASCLDWLAQYAIDHERDPEKYPLFDSCCTDPPYHLTSIVKRFGGKNAAEAKVGATGAYARASRGFMGKEWDGGDIAFRPETWQLVYDVLKPGAHIIAFSGTRTYHRMACAIEDAGFEIRDQLQWLYGSGFPKSYNFSKGIDNAAGAKRTEIILSYKAQGTARTLTGGNYGGGGKNTVERDEIVKMAAVTPEAKQWDGWGTALKPACEPICLARKPLSEKTIAANVLKHGTGALNIDATRVGTTAATIRQMSMTPEDGQPISSTTIAMKCLQAFLIRGHQPFALLMAGRDYVAIILILRVLGALTTTAAPQPASFTAVRLAHWIV